MNTSEKIDLIMWIILIPPFPAINNTFLFILIKKQHYFISFIFFKEIERENDNKNLFLMKSDNPLPERTN